MFSWTFSNTKNRSATWYIIAAIVVISLVIYGIVSQLYLLSVAIVLLAGTFILIENNDSEYTEVHLDENAISLNGTIYNWSEFSHFSIVTAQGRAIYLRLIPKKQLVTVLNIPFHIDVPVLDLRDFLLTILPEDNNNELSSIDALLLASKI